MQRFFRIVMLLALLCSHVLCAHAQPDTRTTRALLVACSDFKTQEDLGAAISGNLHMVGSALISADIGLGNLSIEDGTIGTVQALGDALSDAFAQANEDDLSILYLCTHGVLSSSDDEQVYLLLGDGQTESMLGSGQLYEMIRDIQGEKLLILDACHSGAWIGRGLPAIGQLPGSRPAPPLSPFLADSSVHVLTSSSGSESSWYYDSEGLSFGAVSYFASALSSGLGLYGNAEADLNGDGAVSLDELHRHLSIAVPSSSSQLLSCGASELLLPVAQSASLPRPLTGFSYGSSLLSMQQPALDFSFTVTREDTGIQYRLVDFIDGHWDWANARTFLDEGDDGSTRLGAGRKQRVLSLEDVMPDEGGYLMLQVFSVSADNELVLCSERLIAMQPDLHNPAMTISVRADSFQAGTLELPIAVSLSVPAELTVSVFDSEGVLVRRLASSQLTRPTADNITHFYWDGRDQQGQIVTGDAYTITAEARLGGKRFKAITEISIVTP